MYRRIVKTSLQTNLIDNSLFFHDLIRLESPAVSRARWFRRKFLKPEILERNLAITIDCFSLHRRHSFTFGDDRLAPDYNG